MKKNKIKLILIIFVLMLFVSGISICATYEYMSKDVSYTKEDGTIISVEDALNELYKLNSKPKITKLAVTGTGATYSNYYYFYITDYENYSNLTLDNLSIQLTLGSFRLVQQNDGCGNLKYNYAYNPENGCITITLDGSVQHQSWEYPRPTAIITIIE